jgi:hypothetical protein
MTKTILPIQAVNKGIALNLQQRDSAQQRYSATDMLVNNQVSSGFKEEQATI